MPARHSSSLGALAGEADEGVAGRGEDELDGIDKRAVEVEQQGGGEWRGSEERDRDEAPDDVGPSNDSESSYLSGCWRKKRTSSALADRAVGGSPSSPSWAPPGQAWPPPSMAKKTTSARQPVKVDLVNRSARMRRLGPAAAVVARRPEA